MSRDVEACKPAVMSRAHVGEFLALAASGLGPMLRPDCQLFCCRRKLSRGTLVNEGLSLQYTMMCLLGLARYEASGHPAPVDTRPVLRSVIDLANRHRNMADVGLLLWLCGDVAPEYIPDLRCVMDLRDGVKRLRHARAGLTMDLAWLLAGLAHVEMSSRGGRPDLTATAFEVCRLLVRNQGPHGFFGHGARSGSLPGLFRGHIGSFADQAYPIYALSKFGQAYQNTGALQMARRCGEALCRAQGPLGQWWWHYNARTGVVVEKYPVYSVHQHGMAPMALLALSDATGVDFSEAISRGMRWITGASELRTSMVDPERRMIWRCICHDSRWKAASVKVLYLLGEEEPTTGPNGFRTLFECWPYELGWLLYAWAGRDSAMNGLSPLSSQTTV